MSKWLRLLCILAIFFFFAGLISFIVDNVLVSLAEYTKTGRCYRNGLILSSAEIRTQMIRNLLTAEMESSEEVNKYDTWVQTFLIRQSLMRYDVINAVESKSIVNFPRKAAYPLNTDQDVTNVDSEFLGGEFSIVRYGAGDVKIIPSRSLEAADANIARKSLDGTSKKGFDLSLFERALGYGNYYYQIDIYSFINLRCCEQISHQDGKDSEWYTQKIVDSIVTNQNPISRYLVVSNCGDILHREMDDGTQYYFSTVESMELDYGLK